MRHDCKVLAGLGLACVVLLGACSGTGSSRTIPSQRALVVPSFEARTIQALSGLPVAGSDHGPFSGRRDARLGVAMAGPERVIYGYERQIFDRKYTNMGRPYNTYMDTTRSTTRVDR